MIGERYWSTGIMLAYGYAGHDQSGWTAKAEFFDDGFADNDPDNGAISTEGEIRSRYMVRDGKSADALTVVLDVVRADAQRLGIEWRSPALYYKGDGEDEDYPPPDGWRSLIGAQAARLGWRNLYGGEEQAAIAAARVPRDDLG
jgi:hypothetical protein